MSKKQGGPVRLGKALRLLAGAAMAVLLPAVAPAQQKTLYVGMNGGGMAEAYAKHVFPDFERAQGVRIEVVPGTSAEVLARAQAQKGKPGMHLMFLDDGVMVRAVAAGLCQPLRDDPVLRELYPTAVRRDRKAVGLNVGMTGLGYNTRLFARQGWAPPTSWMDLADPRYKGKVVMQSAAASTFGLHAFLMFNRIQGGTDADTNPGFRAWPGSVGANVREYLPDSARLGELVEADEAALFPLSPTAVMRLKRMGVPVEYAAPKEGSAVLMVAECVVARNSEPELSQQLALYLLSVQAQVKALETGSLFPSNKNVSPPPDHVVSFKRFQGYMTNAKIVNWERINADRPAFNARWNKMIVR